MNRTSHIGQMLVLVGFLGASRIFFHVYLDYTADDAYTTYRYARNIANGEGFVYNLGERVQGTSTPLFTLILAGCGYAVGVEHIPLASRVIAFVADITSLVLLWIVLSEATELARFVACALLVVYPKVVLVSVSGMEAPIVVVLMLLSYVLLFNLNSPKAAIVVLVLLLACRMDAIIWIGVCVWRAGWPQLKGAATVALVSGCIYVGWLVFSYLYFGSFLPNVLIAKVVSYSHLFPWFDPVRVFGGYVPFEGLKGHAFVVRCAAFTLLLFPPIVQLVRLIRRPSPLVAFPLFFLAYNIAFSAGRTVMVDWYYLPGFYAYFVCVGLMFDMISKALSTTLHAKRMELGIRGVIVIVCVVSLPFSASRWEAKIINIQMSQNAPIGEWLRTHGGRSAQVLLEPVGLIGWISDSYIHDFVGLVSPAVVALRLQHPGSDSWLTEYTREYRPDFVVQRDWEIPSNCPFNGFGDGMFKDESERDWFMATYAQVEWDTIGSQHRPGSLVLFQRIDRGEVGHGK